MRIKPARLAAPPRQMGPPAERPTVSPRHERLFDEMELLFRKTGFLHLQTNELAAALHCSKKTLYQLAPTRMQLLQLVLERMFDRICREAEAAADQVPEWRHKIEVHLDAAVHATQGLVQQFLYDMYAFPVQVEAYRKRRVDAFAEIIRAGTKAGRFKPVHPRLAAEALLRAVTIAHDANFIVREGLTLPQAHAQLHKLMLDGLLASTAKPQVREASPKTRARRRVSRSKQGGPVRIAPNYLL